MKAWMKATSMEQIDGARRALQHHGREVALKDRAPWRRRRPGWRDRREHVGEETDEPATRRKTSLTAWMTQMSCRSTGGAVGGARVLQVAQPAVLADAGVVREDEGAERQRQGDIQVGGGHLKPSWLCSANGSGTSPIRLAVRTKKNAPATKGNQVALSLFMTAPTMPS